MKAEIVKLEDGYYAKKKKYVESDAIEFTFEKLYGDFSMFEGMEVNSTKKDLLLIKTIIEVLSNYGDETPISLIKADILKNGLHGKK